MTAPHLGVGQSILSRQLRSTIDSYGTKKRDKSGYMLVIA